MPNMKTLSDMNEMLVAYLEATKDVEQIVEVNSYVVNIDNECVCSYTYLDSHYFEHTTTETIKLWDFLCFLYSVASDK